MMRAGGHGTFGLTAALATAAALTPVRAAEITDLYGSWGHPQGGYNCSAQPGHEDMPVTIRKDEAGDITVGAYAWLCSARDWTTRGAFFTAQTSCGHEGDEEITSERVDLALSNDGQLVLVRDTSVDVLSRCPAAN